MPTVLDDKQLEEAYRRLAIDLMAEDGVLVIDDNAVVSIGDDPGAYVQAWVWVDDTATIQQIKEPTND